MLFLLPPSEGKAAVGDGPPVSLPSLALQGLTEARRRVIDALVDVCAREDAAVSLGLPARQAEAALARNRAVWTAAALPAARLYTGVLYDRLDLTGLEASGVASEELADRLLIFSGLWGVLRTTDRVPPYRLAMSATLPTLGRLSTYWRPALTGALPPRVDTGAPPLIVDLRSAPYAAAWRPPAPAVTVRVFRERVVGGSPVRTVVSHMAKATRGALAHDLLAAGARPATPDRLLKDVIDLGYTAELNGTNLDVVVSEG